MEQIGYPVDIFLTRKVIAPILFDAITGARHVALIAPQPSGIRVRAQAVNKYNTAFGESEANNKIQKISASILSTYSMPAPIFSGSKVSARTKPQSLLGANLSSLRVGIPLESIT